MPNNAETERNGITESDIRRVNGLIDQALEAIRAEGNKAGPLSFKTMATRVLKHIRIIVNDIPTACVYRNKKYLLWEIAISGKVRTVEEVRFMLLHEVAHIILRHFDLTEEEQKKYNDHTALNIAMDAQLNSYIIDDDTERYVAPIMAPEAGKGYSGLNRIREHLPWQDMYSVAKKEVDAHTLKIRVVMPGQNGDDGEGVQPSDQDGDSDNIITVMLTSDRDGSGVNEKSSTGNPDADALIDKAIKEALGKEAQDLKNKSHNRGGGKQAGTEAADVEVIFDDLIKNASVHEKMWRKILRKYMTGVYTKPNDKIHTYRKPNRRFGESIRGVVKECNRGRLAVLVDCSGSMCDTVKRALQDTASISGIIGGIDHLLFWNTSKQAEFRNIKKSNISKVYCKGNGGTILSGGIRYLVKSDPSLIVILTDLAFWGGDEEESNDYITIEKCSQTVPIVIGSYDGGRYNFKSKSIHLIDLDEDGV